MADPGTPNPIRDAAWGITSAILERLIASLSSLPAKINNRELAFLGSPETIKKVREKRASAEYSLLASFLGDDSLWPVVACGLTLRDLEGNELELRRLLDLRQSIHQAHGDTGVRIAEIVQMGILTDLVSDRVKHGATQVDIRGELRSVIANFLDHMEFIKTGASHKELCRKVSYKVSISSPQIMVGRGSAVDAVRRIARELGQYPGVTVNYHESRESAFVFVFRADQWKQLMADRGQKAKKR